MASRLGIAYHVFNHKPTGHPYWEKPKLMLQMCKNYDCIIWLDADTLWVDGDLREANHTHPLAMTWHDLGYFG